MPVTNTHAENATAVLPAPGLTGAASKTDELRAICRDADLSDGQYPYVRGLLLSALPHQRLYILALNQKHLRLFLYNAGECEELPWPAKIPVSLDAALAFDQPDHLQENRSSAGPDVGSMKGIAFGTSSDNDSHGEYLHQFFTRVDHGLFAILHDAPTLTIGVEEDVAPYRKISRLRQLDPGSAKRNPSVVNLQTIGEIARAAILEDFARRAEEALAEFKEMPARNRALQGVEPILEAAKAGRVLRLIVADEAANPKTGAVDPVNAAVVETLRRGRDSEVFVLPAEKMGDAAPMAAILRY